MSARIVLIGLIVLLSTGCATYVTPAAGVSMAEISDRDLRDYYEVEPAAAFPANIAVVRVQDAGYRSRTNHGYGHGRYTIVTTRDIETDEAFERIVKLPMVGGVAPLGRLLLPSNASTIRDLRAPAAKLRADLLLIYSVDTDFSVEGRSLGPLSAISLGFIRNKKANVTATVAGALVDVRTGFIYGLSEASASEQQKASVWSTEMAIDTARLRAEKAAFRDFMSEFETLWKGVVDSHAATRNTARPRANHDAAARDVDTNYRIDLRHD